MSHVWLGKIFQADWAWKRHLCDINCHVRQKLLSYVLIQMLIGFQIELLGEGVQVDVLDSAWAIKSVFKIDDTDQNFIGQDTEHSSF